MTTAAMGTSSQPRVGVGFRDVLVCGNALLALFAIVEVPPIPIVPALYLAPIALLTADAPMRRSLASLTASRPLLWLTALLALRVVLILVLQPLTYETFSVVGRYTAAWLGLVVATLYAMSAPERFRRLAWTLVVAGGASALWLVLEAANVTPFTEWRQLLYADIYLGTDESLAESIRSGLTPYRHQMGYHLAAFVPLAVAITVGRRTNRTARVVAGLMVVIGLVALAASLQRSSLVAVSFGLVVLAMAGGRAGTLAVTFLVCTLGAASIGVLTLRLKPELAAATGGSLLYKLQSEEQQLDSQFRLRLQGRAVELLVQHPLGLAVDAVDWNEVGFRHTFQRLRSAPGFYERPFAVHNGYLVDAVQYGVAFFLLTLAVLVSLGVVVVRLLQRWPNAPLGTGVLALGAAAAAVGTLGFQTLTHNASLTSMEPASVWLVALLAAADRWCTPGSVPARAFGDNGGVSA